MVPKVAKINIRNIFENLCRGDPDEDEDEDPDQEEYTVTFDFAFLGAGTNNSKEQTRQACSPLIQLFFGFASE